jgi:hypothetical protein
MGDVLGSSGPPQATLVACNHANHAQDSVQRSLFTFEQMTSEGDDHYKGGSKVECGKHHIQNKSAVGAVAARKDAAVLMTLLDNGAGAGESRLSLQPEATIDIEMAGEDKGPAGEVVPTGMQRLCEVAMPSDVTTSSEDGTSFESEHVGRHVQRGATVTMEPRVPGEAQESELARHEGHSGSERASLKPRVTQSMCSNVEQRIDSQAWSGVIDRELRESGELSVLEMS